MEPKYSDYTAPCFLRPILLPSKLRPCHASGLFPSAFRTIPILLFSFVLHALPISSPHRSNYSWRKARVMKLLIVQFLQLPVTSHHLLLYASHIHSEAGLKPVE
jgi:hypothetical protein